MGLKGKYIEEELNETFNITEHFKAQLIISIRIKHSDYLIHRCVTIKSGKVS